MIEEAELIGGISVSIGASDAQLVGDLERAEALVQDFIKQQRTLIIRAQTTGLAGGGGGVAAGAGTAAAVTQADVQRMASSALIAVARSPQLPSLIARIDRLRPTQVIPQAYAPATGRRAAREEGPILSMVGGSGRKTKFDLEDLPPSYQQQLIEKLGGTPPATAAPAEARPARRAQQPAAAEAAVEIPASSVDTTALATQLNQIVATFSSFNDRLATALAAMPSAGSPVAGPAAQPVPSPSRGAGRTRAAPAAAAEGDEEVNQYAIQLRPQPRRYFDAEASRLGQAPTTTAKSRATAEAETQYGSATVPELSYDAQREGANRPPGAAPVGRQRTQAQQAAFVQAASGPAFSPTQPRSPEERRVLTQRLADQNELRRQDTIATARNEARNAAAREADEASLTRSRGGRTRTELQREQAIEAQVTRQRAGITAAGRTGRTESFGLGALFGGTQGRFIEASRRQADALSELNKAQAAAQPIRERIADYDERIAKSPLDKVLQKQRDAYASRKEVVAILDREVKATKELEGANLALQKLQGPTSIARNLAAGAAGGAAFGLAMTAAGEGIKALEAAATPTVQRLTGFAAVTADYTSSLADATRAASGNAQAVTALKLASTGLASTTASTIQPLVQQRASIEAGNKAIEDQINVFRVSENLRRQRAGAGITGGTGGLLGTSINAIPGVDEQIGNFLQQMGDRQRGAAGGEPLNLAPNANTGIIPRDIAQFALNNPITNALGINKGAPDAAAGNAEFARGLAFVNAQLVKGGDSADQFAQDLSKLNPNIEITAKAFDAIGASKLAQQSRDLGLFVNNIANIKDPVDQANAALKATQAINIAAQRPSPELLAQQFNQADAAMVRALGRTTQFALKTQLPAQAQLQNLAQPLLAPGTGIPGGAVVQNGRQTGGTPGQQRAIDLQKQLNAYYAQGQQEIINTYKPEIVQQFGQAAGNAFQQQIDGIAALGKEIAGLQTDIANTSVAQQTKEYNYQLFIARRTLSDIGGLTGRNFGAGQSYLGILEKQNLALSRQAQQLQFNLSQRQINFQTALAGFEAPGVTPEERQARIKEAQIEAEFAQKQLNISKQIFGNQVQIIDISNLRQGADLAKQIGLLISGRQASIRIAVDQQQLILAQKRSAQLAEQAGKYLSAVDTIAATGISHIQDLETAAGRALTRTETKAVTLFSNFVKSLNAAINSIVPTIPPPGTKIPPGGRDPFANRRAMGAVYDLHASGAMYQTPKMNAPGDVYQTNGPTEVSPGNVAGEAGTETVAILRNVRPYSASGGGGSITIGSIFSGPVSVRSNEDIDEIARKVERVMGRKASQIGLRSVG